MKRLLFLTIVLAAGLAWAQNDLIFFSDSNTGDKLYDSSWGFQKAPSLIELAGNNDKFPVDAQHPYQGAHSLRLHWTSKAGGDWGAAVAAIGWPARDITPYDSLSYWINARSAIAVADLPSVAFEDVNNKKSTRIFIGDYFGGVDDDSTTWQRVLLPLNAFQPGTENCNFTKVKTIFHYQRTADDVEHLAWIDDIRIIKKGTSGPTPPAVPSQLMASGHDSRIDLKWRANTEPDLLGYHIYRSVSASGPFDKVNPVAHVTNLYSDFFGVNDTTFYYRVTAINQKYAESTASGIDSARSVKMSDDELLSSVQEAALRYFYDYGHPVSGLARERTGSDETCTSGGTGFGLMTIMVGAERGFITRDSAAVRILKILSFLQDVTPRYHGAWSHWIDGTTGATIPFSRYDDGGDLVETAYLVQGILTIRQYFNLNNPVENEIRTRATQLWESVDWNWYRRMPQTNGNKIFWHWSPTYEWQMNMMVEGFNEAMIVYLLAIASPTHPVPATLFYDGWTATPQYVNGNSYYGYQQWVGWPMGGPLFFTHYSFLGFDPRNKQDKFCNYFENNRNISLIHRAYCIANPKGHQGYSSLVWGLTASDNPWGYAAQEPNNDNGTITPTAALSAMPYTPEESFATLKHFYFTYGPRLWGEFGFRDAFNLDQDWFANSVLAIDQGTIAPMIENYRTQLCWNMFMANPEIQPMLDAIGWTTAVENKPTPTINDFNLYQNYPNPFNAQTVIRFSLAKSCPVTLELYNLLGEKVATILSKKRMNAGEQTIEFRADQLSSGIYFYRLDAGDFSEMKKMVLVR
ncbi:hypothetical protein A2V82_16265 [candidate division KSB1 bacterium RBG_16_48_16]|nr:MAG: hypothetical protein A2V82_16265 [candidate division KSB1 bacterium RBG_16_48_16]